MSDEYFNLFMLLQKQIDREYNPFEHDNQSQRYKLLVNANDAIVNLKEASENYDECVLKFASAVQDETIHYWTIDALHLAMKLAKDKQELALRRFLVSGE
jgi:hypothetical protein